MRYIIVPSSLAGRGLGVGFLYLTQPRTAISFAKVDLIMYFICVACGKRKALYLCASVVKNQKPLLLQEVYFKWRGHPDAGTVQPKTAFPCGEPCSTRSNSTPWRVISSSSWAKPSGRIFKVSITLINEINSRTDCNWRYGGRPRPRRNCCWSY